MRKTTLLLCFLVVLMPIISQVATADYTVLNGGTSTVWLVVGTWMDKYKNLPEGYHVRGYYKVPPGECFIIRWGGGNYYIRMHKWVDGAQKLIRPSDHAERDSFAFPIVPKKRFRVVERGEVIRYSSVKRETLVKTGGFYEYKDGGTFHVSGPNLDKAKQALQPTVHALLVIDDADRKIGPSCVVDKTYIEDILSSVRHICPVQTKTLRSSTNTMTAKAIQQWLSSLTPSCNDVVFIYYSGHGGMNKTRGTFLNTQGERLWRDTLVKSIRDVKRVRLKMLITDCCSSPLAPPRVRVEEYSSSTIPLRIYKNLFLQHSGFLHITSATEGELAFGRNPPHLDRRWDPEDGFGGWFTRGLINAINSIPDANRDGFVSWREVFQESRLNTMRTFNATRFSTKTQTQLRRLGQTSQTPRAYSLPAR